MKNLFLTIFLLSLSLLVKAQAPEGYYSSAFGKTERELKTAMKAIIEDHTARTYANLWTDFQTTDRRADGRVWDMYSNCNFIFVTDQDTGTGGTAECQYYNREHSMPHSWFGGNVSPMYTDLFHLYPTDKYVNNRRGNSPFGAVNTPTQTFSNGGKLGQCYQCGNYSGAAFEPANQYKGDFARTYFYMVTRYEDVVTSWYNNADARAMLNGTTYPAFQTWAINLLLKWHREDPVSEKETDRNNTVFGIQYNRNPFIDFPELAEYIWGTKMSELFDPASNVEDEYLYALNVYIYGGALQIENLYGGGLVSIYNVYGQLLSQTLTNAETLSISLTGETIFIVSIIDSSGKVSTHKLIK